MNKFFSAHVLFPVAAASIAALTFSGCNDLSGVGSPNPYGSPGNYGGYGYPNGGYGAPYGGYDNHDYYEQQRLERERDRLHDEKKELERERKRAQEERDRLEEMGRHRDAPPPPPHQPDCPPGFRPSDHNCTTSERKHGCKDLRGPTGVRCTQHQ